MTRRGLIKMIQTQPSKQTGSLGAALKAAAERTK